MAENGSRAWVLWLAGILFTIILTAITALASNMVQNDRDSRLRDTTITDSFNKCQQDIVIQLAEIKTELKFIKAKIK